MRINSSGNIGIGTSNPGYLLDINGSMRCNDITCSAGNAKNDLIGSNAARTVLSASDDGKSYLQYNNDFNICKFDNNTSSIYIESTSGNVGINTTNPGYTLDVSGKIKSSQSLLAIHNSNTIGNLYTTGGNVGINISNPNYTLDVNGAVHIKTDLHVDGLISGGTGTGSTFAYLTLTSTDESINSSTGSLLTYGGITIQCPTDASSITNGGSILTDGGASIGKNVYVGDSLNVTNNINTNKIIINSTENPIGIGTNGSLSVLGGTSISKDVYIGQSLTVTQSIMSKDIFINSTKNAIGVGTGGSLTVLGGASISKDIYVGGTVTSSSDIRLKTNITEFKKEDILNKIDNLRSIKYNYINDDSMTPYIGFIAQDFIEDFSELLRCPENGYYSLDYQKMSVILLECVKELRDKVSLLQTELTELKPVKRKIIKGGKLIITEREL
jgi:hypothetical protein